MSKAQNTRVQSFQRLMPPNQILQNIPISDAALNTVSQSRQTIAAALRGTDKRLVMIVGPCSIHDPNSAIEYATKLKHLADQVSDTIFLVMRVYFEKPRTTTGWKGLLYDPNLDATHDLEHGIQLGRSLLLRINELGLPCATEFVDPIVPQYLADLISWTAIGARTTESQTHRQMASGLSMPVGLKNATDGSIKVALNGIQAATAPHAFVGIDNEGHTAIVRTRGNPESHLVLRGGNQPNYSTEHITTITAQISNVTALNRPILVDCSHANSGRDFRRQPEVFHCVLEQIIAGGSSILGMMLESHLVEGNQQLSRNLKYGQSITDACIGWETTEALLLKSHAALKKQASQLQ